MLYAVMAIIISVILIFSGIAVLVFIHVCVIGRALRRGFGGGNLAGRGGAGNSSMSRDDVEKLPCFEYVVMEEGNRSSGECAVCLESFKMGEKCRLLPSCKHSFHAQCVDEWLLVTPICPLCRTSTAESLDGGGGGESSRFSDLGARETAGSHQLGAGEDELAESRSVGGGGVEAGNQS